ncbi:S1C family serine protease [uncultured Tessaracoccus sp.]|uniref:S1C family serine protease n=1 Tax=uncultured Tessaracoccus sp. TaxID=905023 RepID=UPI00262FDC82|nr:trypsin-like peptidase domain-containing protein [uncultured Tessaracoccus sp.]
MSSNPNPWSRDAHQPVPGGESAPQPRPQHPTGFQSPSQGYPGQPASPSYPAQPFQQPQPQQPAFASTAASGPVEAPRKRGGGKLVAGVLGLTLLAGGVGAGSAALTTQYMLGLQPAAVASSGSATDGGSAQGASSGATVQQADPSNPNWTAVADNASKSVVAIQVASERGGGQGSGVVVDKAGNIVTNNHVVNGAQQIRVTLGDQTYDAELVGTDPSTDLAVIRLVNPPSNLQPMAWGDSQKLKVGDPVMAIGNPLGLSNTVTTGIVSALDRPVTTQAVGSQPSTMSRGSDAVVTAAIQTNAAINPGNSGGALVNSSGQLVGITSSIASLSGEREGGTKSGNIGIGFAIGAYQAKHVVEQLISNGKAQYPQIGITARDVQTTGQMGAEVAEVIDGSPAAEAGLRPGDVVTAIGGRQVSSTAQLVGLVRAQQVGQSVNVTYLRAGTEHTVQVKLVAPRR